MRKKVVWLTVNTLLVAVLFLAACGLALDTTTKPIPALENTTWELQSYGTPGNLKTVLTRAYFGLKKYVITIVFEGAKGQFSGSSGVNLYGGSYEMKENKLSIQKLDMTLMDGPQLLLDQEKGFLNILKSAESYEIESGELIIICGNGVLIFREK